MEKTTLECAIDQVMVDIQEGRLTPQSSGIGKLMNELHTTDKGLYLLKIEEYKRITRERGHFSGYKLHSMPYVPSGDPTLTDDYCKGLVKDVIKFKNSPELTEAQRQKHIDAIMNGIGKGGHSDDDLGKAPREAKHKVPKQPKIKIPKQPKVKQPKGDRVRTVYKLNGQEYNKGQLVIAILREHVSKTAGITFQQLKTTFPDTLLKGYGIFQNHAKALDISKVRKRFFLKEDQLIKVTDETVSVCNQWSDENIQPFLGHAKKLGFNIE